MRPTKQDTPPDRGGGSDTMTIDAVRRPTVGDALVDELRRELDAVKRRVLVVARSFEGLATEVPR